MGGAKKKNKNKCVRVSLLDGRSPRPIACGEDNHRAALMRAHAHARAAIGHGRTGGSDRVAWWRCGSIGERSFVAESLLNG